MSTEIPSDVRDAVHEILKNHAENDTSAMTAESTLEELGIDSLAVIEIIYDVEEKFDITVPDISEIEGIEEQFKTVGDVVTAIGGLVVKARSDSAAE